jgi:hypothetical protein
MLSQEEIATTISLQKDGYCSADSDDDTVSNTIPTTSAAAIEAVQTLRNFWMARCSLDSLPFDLQQLEDAILKETLSRSKQTVITNFFKSSASCSNS